MKQGVEDERLIKQYLLGEVADEQQTEVQDRLLTDPEFSKLLLLLENELTDEYLSGGLSQNELERFDSYFFAAPERRQKLKFAKALNKYVSHAASQHPQSSVDAVRPLNWWQSWLDLIRSQNRLLVFSLGTAALVLAAAGVSLVVYRGGMKYEVAQVRDDGLERAPSTNQERMQGTDPHQSQTSEDAAEKKVKPRPAASTATKSPKTGPPQREQEGEREQTRSLLVKPPLSQPTSVQQKIAPPSRPPSDSQAVNGFVDREQKRADRRGLGGALLANAKSTESLTLAPGAARDVGTTKTVEITAATERLFLELLLDDGDYHSYRAELKTANGNDVGSRGELQARQTPSGKVVLVNVAAKLLVSDDYIVALRGLSQDGDYERVGTYHFRVIRK